MIKIEGNIGNFLSAEEYYNYFKTLQKEDNINILYEPIFRSKILFEYLKEKDLIDLDYVISIKQKLGAFYIGEKNNNAILDCELLIDYIYKRECISGRTKQDIEDFFLYHISYILANQAKDEYARNCINVIGFEKKYGKKEIIEIYPIPEKIKKMKLRYLNKESIIDKLEALKELSNDENAIKIIESIKTQLE